MDRITPENIKNLKQKDIFVFGSNESGFHGAGAAKHAELHFGAKMYKGWGPEGNTFAIPTKNWTIKTLPLDVIEHYVHRFIEYVKLANENNELKDCRYFVTPIGCGLAGYEAEDIAPMFKDAIEIENIYLPKSFWEILNEKVSNS